jgi:hypothetical protein
MHQVLCFVQCYNAGDLDQYQMLGANKMNSTRSYSWFIPLGGFIGFVIGVVLAIALFNVSPAWEQQIYPSISEFADPAVELIGFDYQGQFLYVRTKSQKIYQCHVAWPSGTTTTVCTDAKPNNATKLEDTTSCRPVFPTLQPPGNVVSTLEASPCQDDAHLQIDYVILSDNSIWRLIQSSGGVGESLVEFFTLVSAAVGTLLGIIIGFAISRIARHRSTA